MAYSRYENIGFFYDCVRVAVPGVVQVNDILQGKSNRVKENYEITNKIFQLGWSSLAVLNAQSGKFNIVALYRITKTGSAALPAPAGNYETVVTRGVCSCTYIHIRSGAFHVVAHLDEHNLTPGLQLIRSLVEAKPSLILEISRLSFNAEEEKNFATGLRSLPNVLRIKEFYRGGIETKAFYSHIEIGVDAAGGKTYGDTVDLPKLVAGQCEIPLFSDFDDLTIDPRTDEPK